MVAYWVDSARQEKGDDKHQECAQRKQHRHVKDSLCDKYSECACEHYATESEVKRAAPVLYRFWKRLSERAELSFHGGLEDGVYRAEGPDTGEVTWETYGITFNM